MKTAIFSEWLIANCGRSLTEAEWLDIAMLWEEREKQGLSKAEQNYLKHLYNKGDKYKECVRKKRLEFQFKAIK